MKKISHYLFLFLFLMTYNIAHAGELNTGKKRFGERWKVSVRNYFVSGAGGYAHSKISYQDALKTATDQCQKRMRDKGFKDKAYGCLIHDIISGSSLEVLKSDEYEEIVWNREVDKFEKTLKPEDIIEGIKYKTKKRKKKIKQAQ